MDFDTRLLIFAKAPIPGQCKTRLIPFMNAEQASQLHAQLVSHTLEKFAQEPLCKVALWCTPDIQHDFFQHLHHQHGISLHKQSNGDLGTKMANAAKQSLETCRYTIIIGTDCPALTRTHIKTVIEDLKGGNDASLIPAGDGGYVLIGLQRFDPSIFENIDWGTDTVMQQTVAKLNDLGWRWQRHKALNDIDRADDVKQLLNSGFIV